MMVLMIRDGLDGDLPFFMYVNVPPLPVCGWNFRIHKFSNSKISEIPEFGIQNFRIVVSLTVSCASSPESGFYDVPLEILKELTSTISDRPFTVMKVAKAQTDTSP